MRLRIVWDPIPDADGRSRQLLLVRETIVGPRVVGKFRDANGKDEIGRILMVLPKGALWR